jgi:DNA-binding PadR family transcriptional regulator
MKTHALYSDLELSLLGLLREQMRTGYEIRQMLGASPGAVYPALRRLQEAGLIDGQALTPAGRRALRQALAQPIDKDQLRRKPDSVALRLRFLTAGARSAFLREYARLCAEVAGELKGADDPLSQHDAAIFTARARWAARTLAKL